MELAIRGGVLLCDKDLPASVLAAPWKVYDRSSTGRGIYVMRQVWTPMVDGVRRRQWVFFHHKVLPKKPGLLVDHANGNTLDCRRDNLRYASPGQNAANRAVRSDNRLGQAGVSLTPKGYYIVRIQRGGKRRTRYAKSLAEAVALRDSLLAPEAFAAGPERRAKTRRL